MAAADEPPPTGSRPPARTPRPTGVKAPHGGRVLEISWADGRTTRYPHDLLRGYCPCAGCQGHQGDIRYIEGGNLELVNLAPVGNYALGLEWGDGHSSGIYSFRYLRQLADFIEREDLENRDDKPELPR